VIPAAFDYHAPRTLDDAALELSKPASKGGSTKVLAGGQSLIPLMKLRLASPDRVLDLGKIVELKRITADRSPIVIGAMATHASIEDSSAIKTACPLLALVAAEIGDRQVRNRGTIGGSLAHADPASDWPAAMLALDAELVALKKASRRTIPARDFFRGLMTTALAPDEILIEIRIPKPGAGGMAYQKVRQSASGFAIAGVACVLDFGPDRVCQRARVGVTGVADRAFRAEAVEKALERKKLGEAEITAAAAHVTDGVKSPLSDIHASGEYRLHLARVHCTRALRRAAGL
jgi:carbon-monoxide dehydrogenase medium subunit